jgi:hypothetical protein
VGAPPCIFWWMVLANMLCRVSWSMDAVSSALTTTVAGGSVLIAGGMAKTAGTRACVMVLMDDSVAIPARRKCAHLWKSCHSYRSSW